MGGDVVLQSSPVMKERETVTDLGMEVNTMATEAVLESCSAGVTTVSSLVSIIILKTTAVRGRPQSPLLLPDLSQASSWSLLQVRSAAGGTTTGRDAAPPRVPVLLARETVTDPVT